MLFNFKTKIEEKEREVSDERPYCKWLYRYVDQVLDRSQYIVKSGNENVPKVSETYEPDQINE